MDFIADLYIPLLALISVFSLVYVWRSKGFSKMLKPAALIVVSVGCVYIVMYADVYFKIWPSLGLDYSTHTALALVFVIYLALNGTKLLIFAIVSMLMYACLMVYQAYHSAADIVTTASVIAPVVLFVQKQRTAKLALPVVRLSSRRRLTPEPGLLQSRLSTPHSENFSETEH
ncbi:hypothetical protein QUF80_02640 [Desulfococcaceae bacterium HSG8]|nr:hypothetical protein [Desulfococcaceae bacterium HSG8]